MDVKFVDDFHSLCDYLCNNEVTLTKSSEMLGKKDLFWTGKNIQTIDTMHPWIKRLVTVTNKL